MTEQEQQFLDTFPIFGPEPDYTHEQREWMWRGWQAALRNRAMTKRERWQKCAAYRDELEAQRDEEMRLLERIRPYVYGIDNIKAIDAYLAKHKPKENP